MKKISRIIVFLILITSIAFIACGGSGGGGGDSSGGEPLDYKSLSGSPVVTLPSGYESEKVIITTSGMTVPDIVNNHYRRIGKGYSIILENNPGGITFSGGYATLKYNYKRAKMLSTGELIDDLIVFYYDTNDSKWKPVDYMIQDEAAGTVTAYTSHFTTFVLAANQTQSATLPAFPACITKDFPSGIGGNGAAGFTEIKSTFAYYKDRDYYIVSPSVSSENAATFTEFGFEGALGLSTCNGNSDCGTFNQHKLYTGTDYIRFKAHTDIDVYVMYDTRGGTGRNDISKDAPWLAQLGFSAVINGKRYFVETTDDVGYYTVYRKSYLKDEDVILHGNRRGVTDSKIQTNYWVIIKNKGDITTGQASDLCVAEPVNPPQPSLKGYVKDTSGVPVSKALISIFNSSGYAQNTSSADDGYYAFSNVPAGQYYVTARRDGYTYFSSVVTIP